MRTCVCWFFPRPLSLFRMIKAFLMHQFQRASQQVDQKKGCTLVPTNDSAATQHSQQHTAVRTRCFGPLLPVLHLAAAPARGGLQSVPPCVAVGFCHSLVQLPSLPDPPLARSSIGTETSFSRLARAIYFCRHRLLFSSLSFPGRLFHQPWPPRLGPSGAPQNRGNGRAGSGFACVAGNNRISRVTAVLNGALAKSNHTDLRPNG